METQITRPIEDAVAGVTDVKHISSDGHPGRLDHRRSSSSSAPTCRRPPTTSAPRSTRRASTCRATSTRRTSAGRDRQPADRLPTRSPRRPCRRRELSWFIDNTVSRDLQAAEGRRPGHPRRRRRPRDQRHRRSRPHGRARASPRPRSTRRCAPSPTTSPAAAPTSAARETDHARARHAADGRRAARRDHPARRRPLRRGCPTSPTSATGSAEVRGFARLNGRPVGRLPGDQDQGRLSDVAGRRPRSTRRSTKLEKTIPGVDVHQDLSRRSTRPAPASTPPARAARGHGPGGAGGVAVPARLARDR